MREHMTWDQAMDTLLGLLHSGKLTDQEQRAVDLVLNFDWGNSPDGKSASERAEKPKRKRHGLRRKVA
jgi:hypothetical protein